MSAQPIGIFDSGIGGLSVWKEIHQLLPNESSVYLADSMNAPYGEKPKDRIIGFSIKNTELLLEQDCKLIVVACNTATTNAISLLRERYPVPFIGIEPATKPAAVQTKTKKIGILATKGTLASELFLQTSSKYRGSVEIIETIGTGLVPIIESGQLEDARPLLEEYLIPMIEHGVDSIVLGCTHYPFLKPVIRSIVPDSVTIVDSGAPVARQTKKVLESTGMLCGSHPSSHRFYTNSDVQILEQFVTQIGATRYTTKYLSF